MKEIHAYLNEDGTYHIEAISEAYHNGKIVDVRMVASRVKISVDILADQPTERLYTVIVEEDD
jgi:hypothetical protein